VAATAAARRRACARGQAPFNNNNNNNKNNSARPFCDADTLADRGQRGRCRPRRLAYDSVRRAE
jgi:hypothetical protein